jgi:hypothetical protein
VSGLSPQDWFDLAATLAIVVMTAMLLAKSNTALDIHTTGLSFTGG